MQKFEYVIKDKLGIHARPAGMLAKESKKYQSKIVLEKEGKKAEATKLMAVMGLGIKCGDVIQVEISGEDENEVYISVKEFFERNL